MGDGGLLPSYYVKLTREQKILFCLCLFRWVFQDSLSHPFIFALSECLQLIGYLYAFNPYPERALEAQKRLKFFMGVIETITPPGFTNTIGITPFTSSRTSSTAVR